MTRRGRDFSLFWLAQAISRFGEPITMIALATGFLVATVGASAFYFDAATFAVSAVLLAALRVRPGETHPFRLSRLVADAAEGLRFLLGQPILKVNTYFSLVAQLALPVVNGLTPVYLVRRFADGGEEFGAGLFVVAVTARSGGGGWGRLYPTW